MKFIMAQRWDAQNFMTLWGGVRLPAIKAEVHELWWHYSLMLGLKNCELRDLDSVTETTWDVDVPELNAPPQIFHRNNMSDLLKLAEGQYSMPLPSNFETIDSWVVLRNPFVDRNNDNLCLVQFQMTTAPEHDLLQAGELRVIRKNEELFGVQTWEGKNIYVVFIVLESWFQEFKKQKWKNADRKNTRALKDKRLGDIRQFALCVPEEARSHRQVAAASKGGGTSSENN